MNGGESLPHSTLSRSRAVENGRTELRELTFVFTFPQPRSSRTSPSRRPSTSPPSSCNYPPPRPAPSPSPPSASFAFRAPKTCLCRAFPLSPVDSTIVDVFSLPPHSLSLSHRSTPPFCARIRRRSIHSLAPPCRSLSLARLDSLWLLHSDTVHSITIVCAASAVRGGRSESGEEGGVALARLLVGASGCAASPTPHKTLKLMTSEGMRETDASRYRYKTRERERETRRSSAGLFGSSRFESVRY